MHVFFTITILKLFGVGSGAKQPAIASGCLLLCLQLNC
jgi:hypothetical protein